MRPTVFLTLAACCVLLGQAFAEPVIIGERDGKDVVTVRGADISESKQKLPVFPGISGKTAGAKGLSLLKVIIPPGGSAKPHVHKGFESAIYLIQGRVETRYGEGLKKSVINEAGDFIFIPPDVPHQPVNLSSTEPAIAIVARNDPEEQEHVILVPGETPPNE
ncbi:cupin domain-containing protein [Methyloceanibacter sp.]|uniref:cupin domain-containing protein n=1 Tax=Methyloceanibacter sp. TaxID=1965321 RepID=UPI002D7024D2|nr:cupin domain-containing protein [Methyloceanibacter sp.]HZP09082.1 cupin domain-containing protein [Methyloceanibacter sp.]